MTPHRTRLAAALLLAALAAGCANSGGAAELPALPTAEPTVSDPPDPPATEDSEPPATAASEPDEATTEPPSDSPSEADDEMPAAPSP